MGKVGATMQLKEYIKKLRKVRDMKIAELRKFRDHDWGESSRPDKMQAEIDLLEEILPELDRCLHG
jgi:hypothetical protein